MREIVSSSPQFIKDTEKETITHKFSPSNLMSFENGLFSRAWSSLFVFSWLFNPPYCLPNDSHYVSLENLVSNQLVIP